jgi:hypothetical protein
MQPPEPEIETSRDLWWTLVLLAFLAITALNVIAGGHR